MQSASVAATRSFLVAFPVAVGAGVVWFASQSWIGVPACFVFEHFGLYCPGCGGTRAVVALLHGDVAASVGFNPLVLGLAVLAPVTVYGAGSERRLFQLAGSVSSWLIVALVVYAGMVRNLFGVVL